MVIYFPVKRFVIALGVVLAVAGFIVGMTDLSIRASGQSVSCGGAFDDLAHGDAAQLDKENAMKASMSRYYDKTDFVAQCEEKKGNFQLLSIGIGVVGAALLIAGFFIPASPSPVGARE